MNPIDERWDLLNSLDEELLQGGVVLSEWCTFLTCDADTAFASGAFLASLLTSMAAIETHLRSESQTSNGERLVDLIDSSGLTTELKADLHLLRRYRNRWVHVSDPWGDQPLLDNPGQNEDEVERMALLAAKCLRKTIYSNPLV
jgi:hypothetical protein